MKIIADIHTHTVLSGHAYSTVLENARGARENGLEIMAITDHGPAMPGASSAFYHFPNQVVIPDTVDGIEILRGTEANILDDEGTLDLPDRVLRDLDIVLAGLHDVCISQGDREQNTRRLIRVMDSGRVDVITHPGNPYFPVHVDRVVEAAARTGVLLEINNTSLRGDVRPGSDIICLEIARAVLEAGLPVVLGSDAHWYQDVGRLDRALALARNAGFSRERILNCSARGLRTFVKDCKRRRFERLHGS